MKLGLLDTKINNNNTLLLSYHFFIILNVILLFFIFILFFQSTKTWSWVCYYIIYTYLQIFLLDVINRN